MKVYILEVGNIGHCYHYQAVFATEDLANQAKDKYKNDPCCKGKMSYSVTEMEVHKDLKILDPY